MALLANGLVVQRRRLGRQGRHERSWRLSGPKHHRTHIERPRLSVNPNCGRVEVDDRVVDIEDVYPGEDGSIQCGVTWKSSLIAILVGRELLW